jgi:hypothetical protein
MTVIASYFDFERLDAFGVECACCETKVSQFDVTCSVDEEVLWDNQNVSIRMEVAYLWFEITVNISQFMKLVNSSEHLADVEPCMFFLEDTRVV